MTTAAEPPAAPTTVSARVREYLSLVRFSHTVFALPFAALAALLAWRTTPVRWQDAVGVLLCMVFARTAAMAFNRLADHRIDAGNPRTAGRHLPAGTLGRREVAALTVGSGLAFIASTALFLPNRWPLMLSVPVLAWLCGYSLAKRFTSLAHYWLAAALGLAPVATWLAIAGEAPPPAWWIAAAVLCWVGGFDILYACQDAEFDRDAGLHSIPARLGRRGAFRVARVSHALVPLMLLGLWQSAGLGTVFLVGVVAVAVLLLVEHLLVSPDDLSRVNAAFFTVNAVISFGVLTAAALDLLLAV